MYIRCWGSRGSIPVSGREFTRYGGETTCLEIRAASGDTIIVDAGTGMRGLGHKLAQERCSRLHVLFTHAHLDHLFGFPFFAPLYIPGTQITVWGHPFHTTSYQEILAGLMSAPYFPVTLDSPDVKADIDYSTIATDPFSIGSLHIQPVHLNHPNKGLGFRFCENGKCFVFLTDNELSYRHAGGLSFDQYVAVCRDADLLIHDGEYTQEDYNRSWGHSIFTDAVRLAMKAGVRQLGLFHLNSMRTDRMVDEMVGQAREMLRQHKTRIKCFAVGCGFQTEL